MYLYIYSHFCFLVKIKIRTKSRNLSSTLNMTSTPRALFRKLLSFNTPTTESHSPVASFPNNVSQSQQYFPSIPKYSINIVLMGDNCTGKSAFLLKQNQGIFKENLQATMGVSLTQKNVRVKVNKMGEIQSLKDVERGDLGRSKQMDVQLRIWDTNGHEKYRQLLPIYIKDDGTPKLCLIFYDVSDRHSFQQIQKFYKIWSEKLSNSPLQKNSVMIVANKIDLEYTKKNNNGQIKDFVGFQEGVQLAKKLGALYVRSSSLFDVQNILKMAIRYKLGQLGYKCQFPQIEKQQINLKNEKQSKQIRKAPSQKMILVDDDDVLVECKKGLTNSDKARLLQLLQIFQNLKSKSKHLNFQHIITKYIKTLQMKICLQQKQTNLSTIKSSLYFLHNISAQLQPKYNNPDTSKSSITQTQQSIQSSIDLNLIHSQIQALQILEKTQQLEIVKVSKVIVNSLRKNIGGIGVGGGEEEENGGGSGSGSGGFRVEDFGEFKDVYGRYREVWKEMLRLLDDQRVKELNVKRETFQEFLDTVITYYDNFTKLTQQLLEETQKNLSDLPFNPSPLPTPSLLSNLLQFFLHQKSQSLTPTSNSPSSSLSSSTKILQLTNLLQKRQQKQILEGMYQKDQKHIEQNRKLILSYVKKIEEIVEDKIIRNGEEEQQMEKWMEEYNGEIFDKQLCAVKRNK